MLVLIAALLSVMLILVVFTTDVAYMQLVRTQLHVSTDAAAKAGMEALARTESRGQARVVAKDIFSKNLIGAVFAASLIAFINNVVMQKRCSMDKFNASGKVMVPVAFVSA